MIDDLKPYGLERCQRCDRVLLAERLKSGICIDAGNCAASEMIAAAKRIGNDELAAGIESGLKYHRQWGARD